MRRRSFWGLSLSAAASVAFAAGSAFASDDRTVVFSSVEGVTTAFATLGAKIGIDPLDRSGILGLVSVGSGFDTVRIGSDTLTLSLNGSFESAAVVGYQWMMDQGVVAAFAGPEAIRDGAARARVKAGARLQAEAWLRPTEETLVQVVTIAHSARGELWTRLAWGYRLWDTYFGPEFSGSLETGGYAKAAFGLHATDFAVSDVHLRMSTGLQWETTQASPSLYLSITAWMSL